MREIRILSVIICLFTLLTVPFVAETNAKYVVAGTGNATQVHFVKSGYYGSDVFVVEDPDGQDSNPLWGANSGTGSTNTNDYTLETLANVELKVINDTTSDMRLTFVITIQVTGGNPVNGSSKTFTVTDTTTGESRSGNNGNIQNKGDGVYEIVLTGTDDFFICKAGSAMHTYTLDAHWSNQTSKGYYATVAVIAEKIN